MPLGPAGRKVKAKMSKEYGEEYGERVFYASMNKKPGFKRAMHQGAKGKGRSTSRGRR